MKPADLSDFSDVLLELYRCSRELPIDTFQDAALELIKPLVPFDMSMWGTATMTAHGPEMHTVHLHRSSQQMLEAYEEIKHLDVSAVQVASRPTVTAGFNARRLFGSNSACAEFTRRFEHENYFITMDSDADTGFVHWASLYRADPDAHCTEAERQLLALLRPHLKQSLVMNRVNHLDGLAPALAHAGQGRAVVDLRGLIHHADDRFRQLLAAEWPSSRSDVLPAPLMRSLLEGSPCVIGRSAVVHRHEAHRLLFLRARPRCLADALAAREQQVARLVARGLTHKEIARDLQRAPATVRNQIQAVYAKLEVNGIAELVGALRALD